MLRQWVQLRSTVPGEFLGALALAAGFMGFVAWDQSHWWRIKEDYSFGWLVPAFVAFMIYDRWPRISGELAACRAPGAARVEGWRKWLVRSAAVAALACGVLLFLLGAFYRAGAGTSQPGTLAITLGTAGILLPLLYFNAPAAERPVVADRFADDPRLRLAALFIFPTLVWLVSAPMVSAVESQLNLLLLRRVVTVVATVFEAFGIPIEQQGNVLVLPNGRVGVEDACSGIRSLTGCLFAGAFLSAVFLERLWRKIVLLAAALLLAFVTNLGRSLFLTAWAHHYGADAIDGFVHDAAGYAVLGLTVVGLLCLLPLMQLQFGDEEAEAEKSEEVGVGEATEAR